MKNFLVFLVGIFLFATLQAQEEVEICAQLGPSENILPLNRNVVVNFPKVIPVVVHIVYTDSIPNTYVPPEAIQPAIDQLNVDFEGTNISFNLAGYDYTDLTTYSWHNGYVSGDVCFPNYQTQATILANDISWDISRYCNIYVIPKMCSTILGYAYVAYTPTNADDGVWVLTKTFGYGDWPHLEAAYNENETLTHELGHYCGLYHTFNNNPGTCGGNDPDISCEHEGDYVCDTPPTKVSYGCPGTTGFYCPLMNYDGAFFNARNHMDYGKQFCRDEFTPGQINRMHAILEYQRYELYTTNAETFCPGDFNNDGNIGTFDLLVILSNWGCIGCDYTSGDLSLDFVVGTADLNWVLSNWGEECGDGLGLLNTNNFQDVGSVSFEKAFNILKSENLVKYLKFYDISGREILTTDNFSGVILVKIFLVNGNSITIKTVH